MSCNPWEMQVPDMISCKKKLDPLICGSKDYEMVNISLVRKSIIWERWITLLIHQKLTLCAWEEKDLGTSFCWRWRCVVRKLRCVKMKITEKLAIAKARKDVICLRGFWLFIFFCFAMRVPTKMAKWLAKNMRLNK